MLTDFKKTIIKQAGVKGLPEHYPTPNPIPGRLFYIQSNHNMDTVVYEVNRLHDTRVNEEFPLNVFWINYSQDGQIRDLNYIQNKLAYGYESKQICKDTYQFQLVSYPKLKLYLVLDEKCNYHVITKINGRNAYFSNAYVFAEELGLFPDVKYIELYGVDLESNLSAYEIIYI